jgi:hypothetical protein
MIGNKGWRWHVLYWKGNEHMTATVNGMAGKVGDEMRAADMGVRNQHPLHAFRESGMIITPSLC